MAKASTAKPFYVCAECGKRFVWVPPSPGRHGRPPLTCSEECRQVRIQQRDRDRYAAKLEAQQRRRVKGSPYGAVPCDVCGEPTYARNLCSLHYGRKQKTGDVGPVGYSVKYQDGVRKSVAEHRFVIEQTVGRPLLSHENVHHINGVRDDNRLENLELWSSSQPSGQRVADKVAWAKELLALYEPDALA